MKASITLSILIFLNISPTRARQDIDELFLKYSSPQHIAQKQKKALTADAAKRIDAILKHMAQTQSSLLKRQFGKDMKAALEKRQQYNDLLSLLNRVSPIKKPKRSSIKKKEKP